MPDMLVPLYKLPPADEKLARLRAEGVAVRRAFPFDLSKTRRFITKHFSDGWADETQAAFAQQPITCWLAVEDKKIVGFGCVDATAKGLFGPTGVAESHRGRGIGEAILLAALHGLREAGYAYAVIGGAGPTGFYEKCCGATIIPDSTPGIYVDLLGPDD